MDYLIEIKFNGIKNLPTARKQLVKYIFTIIGLTQHVTAANCIANLRAHGFLHPLTYKKVFLTWSALEKSKLR